MFYIKFLNFEAPEWLPDTALEKAVEMVDCFWKHRNRNGNIGIEGRKPWIQAQIELRESLQNQGSSERSDEEEPLVEVQQHLIPSSSTSTHYGENLIKQIKKRKRRMREVEVDSDRAQSSSESESGFLRDDLENLDDETIEELLRELDPDQDPKKKKGEPSILDSHPSSSHFSIYFFFFFCFSCFLFDQLTLFFSFSYFSKSHQSNSQEKIKTFKHDHTFEFVILSTTFNYNHTKLEKKSTYSISTLLKSRRYSSDQ